MPDAFTPMARLVDRLNAARTATFTGRATHLAAFRDALAGGPAAVLFVHGPGGVGKTSLLRRYADEARRAGRHVIAIDGRDLPASPSAFSSAAAAALNDPTVVLLVDDFERCQGLEGWLSGTFLPRLPATALTVIAGRNPPARRWSDDAGWAQALRVLPLGNLGEQEARNMLLAAGVAAQQHEHDLAVTQALHDLRLPDRLAANPLIRTRLLAEAGAGERADRLRHLLTTALGALAGDARTAKFHRAPATAYLHAAPTQEASAERLAVSLSTYRRHLARGTNLIAQQLWERELHGNDQ
ncbi:AAA family ATPase [Streptosporangium sp. NPDC050280]|uniref:AAA family ATPase n=1 Tax=unclassified Streptosporangium TaxID=2632669 RepID=UPI003449C719